MNIARLHEILTDTTTQLRKGEVFEGTPELVEQAKRGDEELKGGGVLKVYAMPHESEAPEGMETVDLHFITVGVDREKAENNRDDFISILNEYPDRAELYGGPSYISVGATIGDQGAALQLFALGKVLGLWSIITPEQMGFAGADADELAGGGFIMMSGYQAA